MKKGGNNEIMYYIREVLCERLLRHFLDGHTVTSIEDKQNKIQLMGLENAHSIAAAQVTMRCPINDYLVQYAARFKICQSLHEKINCMCCKEFFS